MIELFLQAVPLNEFDQHKLEGLLRRIPSALVRTEVLTGKERKYYSFPQKSDQGFKIDCTADHFSESPIPSHSSCTMNILKEVDLRVEQHLFEIKESALVNDLFKAISFNSEVKEFYSTERIYGLGVNGRYQQNFRYAFNCSREKCQLTMVVSSADFF